MSRVTVSVVIPALNEELNLRHVLPAIPSDVHEIILVDGNSTDRTVQVAQELVPGIRIVQQPGRGKGDALRAGFLAATGDIIVALDADGSTDPTEIPRFVHALLAGADFAKGSRFLHGAGTSDMPFHRRMGNGFFVQLVRLLYGGRYTDLCYGYNAFWRHHLPMLELDGDGFEIETEMNIRALRSGLRIQEVPSYEDRRVMGVGRLRTVPDGWRVLKTIVLERRRPVGSLSMTPVEIVATAPEAMGPGGNGHDWVNGDGLPLPAAAAHQAIAETNGDSGYAPLILNPEESVHQNGVSTPLIESYIARMHELLADVDRHAIDRLAGELRAARARGSTVFFAGNGGSSATAAHWVNDLAKATKRSGQPPMRVMNLTDNVPWLTALANDEGYEHVFSGQLENFARPEDVLVVISASGNSPNILRAVDVAKSYGMTTGGLLGFEGGAALDALDIAVWVRTEPGAYGVVESTHATIADIITGLLTIDLPSQVTVT